MENIPGVRVHFVEIYPFLYLAIYSDDSLRSIFLNSFKSVILMLREFCSFEDFKKAFLIGFFLN